MARARGTSNEDTLAVNSRTGEEIGKGMQGDRSREVEREMSEYK